MTVDSDSIRASVTAFCTEIGRDRLLVQGAGGNVSWKDGNVLWVKASGCWLAEAGQREIFVPVALDELQQAIGRRDFGATPRGLGAGTLRPSIETMLHAAVPHKVVAHLHAVEALAHLVRLDGLASIGTALDGHLAWRAVEYRKPGADLAEAVADAVGAQDNVDVVLLLNHGIVVGGASVSEVQERLDLLVSRLAVPVLPTPHATASGEAPGQRPAGYIMLTDPAVHGLVLDEDRLARLSSDWALYPDHVVFLGDRPVIVDSIDVLSCLAQGVPNPPELVFVRRQGVFVRDSFNEAKQAQLACYGDVLARQRSADRLRSLTQQDVGTLLNWDAERYRQALNA